MLEHIVNFLSLSSLPIWGILAVTFFIPFLENIFPPSPSDTILLFLGALAGMRDINFFLMLLISTIGSGVGFGIMYWLGYAFGIKIIDSGRFSFINRESLDKVMNWYKKWSYTIIVLNRFLSGTRAVVSFFAGATEINPWITIILGTISSLLWNAILLLVGFSLGENWTLADKYLDLYGNIIFPLILLIIVVLFIIWYIRRKKRQKLDK